MGQNNFYVLLCEDTVRQPGCRIGVLDVGGATRRLEREGIALTVDSSRRAWEVSWENGAFFYRRKVGQSCEFRVDVVWGYVGYNVGVYERTDLRHIQEMVGLATHVESLQHRSKSMVGD